MTEVGNRTADVLIDLYEGAYGATLRIDVQATDRLAQLRELLANLASRKEKEIRLHAIPHFHVVPGIQGVCLNTGQSDQVTTGTLMISRVAASRIQALWSGPVSYWQRCVGLVDGLLFLAPKPGHQYLTGETVGGALVELAFMERSSGSM